MILFCFIGQEFRGRSPLTDCKGRALTRGAGARLLLGCKGKAIAPIQGETLAQYKCRCDMRYWVLLIALHKDEAWKRCKLNWIRMSDEEELIAGSVLFLLPDKEKKEE